MLPCCLPSYHLNVIYTPKLTLNLNLGQVLRRGGRRPALEPLLCGASDDGSDTPTAATPATPPTAPGSTQDFDIPAHEQLEPAGLHPLSGTPASNTPCWLGGVM